MKGIEKLAVIMLAGIVAVSVFAVAQADPGKEKLNIVCTAADTLTIDNMATFDVSSAALVSVCTVNGMAVDSVTPYLFVSGMESDLDIKVMAPMGVAVTVIIDDGPSADKYKVKSDASDTLLTYNDNTGDDKLDMKGDGGADTLTINDDNAGTGAGNDKYEAKDLASLSVTDGAGNDKYEGKKVTMFSFVDMIGDTDKIEVKT